MNKPLAILVALLGAGILAVVWIAYGSPAVDGLNQRGLEQQDEKTTGGELVPAQGSDSAARKAPIDPSLVSGSAPTGTQDTTSAELAAPTIHGRVVDAQGDPIAGARVQARRDFSATFTLFTDPGEFPRVQFAEALTDELGRFTLKVPGLTWVTLFAHAQGYAENSAGPFRASADEVEMRLSRSATVEGFVTAKASGAPVPGARVRVDHGPEGSLQAFGVSDLNGRFVVTDLSPGQGGLIVTPIELAKSRWRDVHIVGGQTQRVDIELEAGWSLSGRALSAVDQQPIVNAEVSSWSFYGKTVRTDEQGRYRIEGATPRPGEIDARAPGFANASISYDASGETHDLTLEPGLRIIGMLIGADGEPREGIQVCCLGMKEPEGWLVHESRSATTGADGSFSIDDVRRNVTLALQLRGAGVASHLFAVPPAPSEAAEIDLGDLQVERPARLAGRVVTAAGGAAVGVRLTLEPTREEEPALLMRTMVDRRYDITDASGAFLMPDLTSGPYQLRAISRGGSVIHRSITLNPDEQRDDLELRLPAGQRLSGTVRGPEGGVLEGVRVNLLPADPAYSSARFETDADGLFRAEGLADGAYQLRLDPGPQHDALFPLVLSEVRADGRHLDLALAARDATVVGQVLDSAGRGVARAMITLDLGDGRMNEAVLCDELGRFEIEAAPNQPVRVCAWRTRRRSSEDRNLTGSEARLGVYRVSRDQPDTWQDVARPGAAELVLQFGPR